MSQSVQPGTEFIFYVSQGPSLIANDVIAAAKKAIEDTDHLDSSPDELRELRVRTQHDSNFIEFRNQFSFTNNVKEELAVFHLYKNMPKGVKVNELAIGLEFVCRYDGLMPASLCGMRFYQSLLSMNPEAAETFAEALSTEPKLTPESVFRNLATKYKIYKNNYNIKLNQSIRYFNNISAINEMEAFAVENLVAIRKTSIRSIMNYADAILGQDDFIRFSLFVYTDRRPSVLEYIKTNGARGALCGALIRTYLDGYEADEDSLIAELDATLRGRPAFASVPRIMVEPRKAPPLRVADAPLAGTRPGKPEPGSPPASEVKA